MTPSLPARLREAWGRHGWRGIAQAAILRARHRSEAVWVWYELDLTSPERPRPQLPEGFELRRAHPEDLWRLYELPEESAWVTPMTPEVVAGRLAEGAELWLVVAGDELAYFCWSFRGHGPLDGARNGTLTLPPGVVWPDDQMTLPGFRRRGIAPAALSGIGDAAAREGARALIGRVHVPNVTSRRMMENSGWREVARMQIVQRNWRTWVRVVFPDAASDHRWLASLRRG